ncbi:hypothetical protein J6590_035876 [Homalodisca vitripennis]|nr:hypothetical protein J6590_035876 [Homalodisca vitripennis]
MFIKIVHGFVRACFVQAHEARPRSKLAKQSLTKLDHEARPRSKSTKLDHEARPRSKLAKPAHEARP